MTALLLAMFLLLKGLGVPYTVDTFSVSAYADVGYTASGEWTRPNTCACGPVYKFGTQFYVEGIGWLTCIDRGGMVTDRHIDMWLANEEQAWKWGRKNLNVVVVK